MMREDLLHYIFRCHLKDNGWILLAGQYPNGSDDELPALFIKDPLLAVDNSPDHRRHSKNKIVPDLIAYKNNKILVIEIKPNYSSSDEKKLIKLLKYRSPDLRKALKDMQIIGLIPEDIYIDKSTFIPVLGFTKSSDFPFNSHFFYLLADSTHSVTQINETITE